MNYEKKIMRKRRRQQADATSQHGMVKIEGTVEIDGKTTTYYPRNVLRFKPGSAAVEQVIVTEHGTKAEDLPPLCPPVER